MINIAELHSRLIAEILKVTFTKKDGTERVMICTLRPDHLTLGFSQEKVVEDLEVPSEDASTIAVWDIEANGWRSFRVDSVISVENALQ